MAINTTTPKASKNPAVNQQVGQTAVRNTPIPKAAVAASTKAGTAPGTVTRQAIAVRAYEIYRSGKGGTEVDNWFRAERELRGM